jgi:hypothetical protein
MASLFELAGSVKEAIFAALHAVMAKPFRVATPEAVVYQVLIRVVDGAAQSLSALSSVAKCHIATNALNSNEIEIRAAFTRAGLSPFIPKAIGVAARRQRNSAP